MSSRTNMKPVRWAFPRMLPALLLALAAPGTAIAQDADEAASQGLELSGFIGAMMPLAKLADSGDTIRAEFSTKLAFGGELDYWFGNGFGIGVTGGYSAPELTLQIVGDTIGFTLPVQLGNTDYWTVTGNLMWRPNLAGSASVVRPYLGVGAGVVSVTYPALPSELDFPPIESETRFAGSILGGAHIEISGDWFARLDVRDYISEFSTPPFSESKLQHDLVTSVFIGYSFH